MCLGGTSSAPTTMTIGAAPTSAGTASGRAGSTAGSTAAGSTTPPLRCSQVELRPLVLRPTRSSRRAFSFSSPLQCQAAVWGCCQTWTKPRHSSAEPGSPPRLTARGRRCAARRCVIPRRGSRTPVVLAPLRASLLGAVRLGRQIVQDNDVARLEGRSQLRLDLAKFQARSPAL